MPTTINKSFTGTGFGPPLMVKVNDKFLYTVSGTFVGTVRLQQSVTGGNSWEYVTRVAPITASASAIEDSISNKAESIQFRFECTSYTSGTIVTALADSPKILEEWYANGDGPVVQITEDGLVTPAYIVTELSSEAFPLMAPINGTASAPVFTNSTGKTGLYFGATEELYFATNQTKVWEIDSAGMWKVAGVNEWTHQSTPAAPASGASRLYFKSDGNLYRMNSSGVEAQFDISTGGDVVGPASATDNAVARFDATTGKLVQNSTVTIGDTGAVSGISTLTQSDYSDFTQIATPSSPSASHNRLYFKSGDGLYTINSSGTEIKVVTSTSGAVSGITSISQSTFTDFTATTTPTTPSASHNRLYFKSDNKIYKLDSSGNEVELIGAVSGALTGISTISQSSYTDFLQLSTPSAPSAGHNRLYFKSDGNLYTLNTSGVETLLTTASSGSITGAASTTTHALARWSNTTGTGLANSTVLLSAAGSELSAPNGTAAATSYGFGAGTGGAGTGLYAAGVNILGFATAGVTVGNISATGLWTVGPSGATVTHVINATKINCQSSADATDFQIAGRATNAGALFIAGAGSNANGAVIGLYGNSHATNPNLTIFQNAAATTGSVSASGLWTLGAATPATGVFHSINLDSVTNNKGLAFNEKTATSSTIICRGDVNTGGIKISGGASGANGGFISIYGGSHASLANVVQIANGAIGSGMFLSAAGTLSVGGAASAVAMIESAGNTLTGTNQIAGYSGVFTGTSAATASIRGFSADVNTAAASFSSGFVSAFYGAVTAGSTSTITRAQIFDAFGGFTATGTISNRAILTDNHAYTGTWAINLSSTAPSQFSGLVGHIQSTNNVTDALPTQAEMVTALGAANQGTALVGFIKDANADTNYFICASNGTSWYALKMTKGA